MTYTIVQPIANTNTSYKDTGRLSWYKYEDLQVLAELMAQANACLMCDAKPEAKGGMTQAGIYSTLWNYLGQYYEGGIVVLENQLAPQKQYLDRSRITNLVDDQLCPWPFKSNTMNKAWLYVTADPFGSYSPYMHRDDRLSAAGTTAGTYALFGTGDVDMRTEDVPAKLSMKRPFFPKAWTDPRDIVSAYTDAKQLSEYDFNMLTWNNLLTGTQAVGQGIDASFDGTDISCVYTNRTLSSYNVPVDVKTDCDKAGWAQATFEIAEWWEQDAYYDYSTHPNQYTYTWESHAEEFALGSGHPTFERNVPIPTSNFGTECLQDRKLMFVWETHVRDRVSYYDTGLDHDTTLTAWYASIVDFTKYGTTDFIDHFGNNRGLCMKYTLPSTIIALQHTSLKNQLNWRIPEFEQQWSPETSHRMTNHRQELNLYLRGCYSLQKSYLTEMLTRP